jgi:hypothetical protein
VTSASQPSSWRHVEQAQHEAIAVDLPGDDAQAGLSVHAERVLEAIGTREAILVAPIASFRSSSSVVLHRNGSMSASTTFPAAISSRSPTHTVLPISSFDYLREG